MPKISGGIVTRMTILPVSGVISDINVETDGEQVSFPKGVRFDLNARVNVQRIIVMGGRVPESES